jgi:hypothetical protein
VLLFRQADWGFAARWLDSSWVCWVCCVVTMMTVFFRTTATGIQCLFM